MTCCASCAAAEDRTAARLRCAMRATEPAAYGAAAGGAVGTAYGGPLGGAIGSYAGGVAASELAGALGDGGASCSEPACSWPTPEEWTAEARARGIGEWEISAAYARAAAPFAQLPAQAAAAIDRDVPNLRSRTIRRFAQSMALADLVATVPPRVRASSAVRRVAWDVEPPASGAPEGTGIFTPETYRQINTASAAGAAVLGALLGGGVAALASRRAAVRVGGAVVGGLLGGSAAGYAVVREQRNKQR